MKHSESASLLFASARGISRFWLPSLLDTLAALPPAMCGGETCSIFLRSNARLHLAATTRREGRSRLFDPDLSYTIDRDALKRAADEYLANKLVTRDAGLTGWVAAFDTVLNLRDQRNDAERRAVAEREHLPFPVWSDRGGGFFDFPGPRPLLSVPLRHQGDVYGIARVHTLRADARPFSSTHEQRLLAFGEQLAAFLVEQDLLAPGLESYFRLWAAEEGPELARRLTQAVPQLFGVDCCSFFQRDSSNRFVLQYSGASERVLTDLEDAKHFSEFWSTSQGRLYYEGNTRSKTGLCIKSQSPYLLQRGEPRRRWSTVVGSQSDSDLADPYDFDEVGGQLLEPCERQARPPCELRPERSHSLLLVPVRDTINPRMLAGVIRVVSTRADLNERNLFELEQFAYGLAGRLGETAQRQIQRESAQRLIEQLGNLELDSDRWGAASRIVARALDADAATIFLRGDDDRYRTHPSNTFLNEDLIERYQPARVADLRRTHQRFQTFCPRMAYGRGEGRTGWVAGKNAILNLKDLDDSEEQRRWGIDPGPFDCDAYHPYCEILDPGPFIAAPISLGPRAGVDGIVRALRWRRSAQGPFSPAHELILSTCTTILAGLHRIWATRSVIISYGSGHAALKDELCRFLKAIGIEPSHLSETPTGGDPGPAFEDLMRQARAGIVIATPDIRASRENADFWMPSDNVIIEMQRLRDHFGDDRVLILKDREVTMPAMGLGPNCWEFSRSEGITPKLVDLAQKLRSWLNLS